MSPPTAVDVHVEGVTDTSSVLLPNPLSLEGIAAKRAKADPIPGGIAAYTSSDFFKSAVSPTALIVCWRCLCQWLTVVISLGMFLAA